MQNKRILERNTSGCMLIYHGGEQQPQAVQGDTTTAKRAKLQSATANNEDFKGFKRSGGSAGAGKAADNLRTASIPASDLRSIANKQQQDLLLAQLQQSLVCGNQQLALQQQQQHQHQQSKQRADQQEDMPVWRQLLVAALLQKAGLPALDEAAAAALPVPEHAVIRNAATAAAEGAAARSTLQSSTQSCSRGGSCVSNSVLQADLAAASVQQALTAAEAPGAGAAQTPTFAFVQAPAAAAAAAAAVAPAAASASAAALEPALAAISRAVESYTASCCGVVPFGGHLGNMLLPGTAPNLKPPIALPAQQQKQQQQQLLLQQVQQQQQQQQQQQPTLLSLLPPQHVCAQPKLLEQQQQCQPHAEAPVKQDLLQMLGLSDLVHAALAMPGVLEAAPLPHWAKAARDQLPIGVLAHTQLSLPNTCDYVTIVTDVLNAHHQVQAALQQALLVGLLDNQPSTAVAGAEAAGACAVAALAGAYVGSFTDSSTSVNTPFGAGPAGAQQGSSSGHAQAVLQHNSSGTLGQAPSLPSTAQTAISPATPAAGAVALEAQAAAASGVIHQLGEGYSKLSACTHGLTSLLLLGTLQGQQQQQQPCQAQQLAPASGAAVAGESGSQAPTASTVRMQGFLDLSQPASSVKVEPGLPVATAPVQQQQQQQQQQTGPQQQQQLAASVIQPQHTGRLTSVAQKVLKVAEGSVGLSQDDRLQLLAAVAELLVLVQDNQPKQD